MTVSIVIGIILLIVVLIMYREYRNEKRYQEERRKKEALKERKLTPKVTNVFPEQPQRQGKRSIPPPVVPNLPTCNSKVHQNVRKRRYVHLKRK
jgi:hypothetical protein